MRNKQWINLFNNGDIAIFRLTPDKYHYNHTPVAGTVIDYYEVDGPSHSRNPGAVVQSVLHIPLEKDWDDWPVSVLDAIMANRLQP